MAVADARVIGQLADKTLFVVRWNKTPKKVARAALDQLRKANIPIAGVVLQQVDLKRYGRLGYGDSGYYYHYGRYGQYYSSPCLLIKSICGACILAITRCPYPRHGSWGPPGHAVNTSL